MRPHGYVRRFEEPVPKEDGAWQSPTGGSVVGFTYELLEELDTTIGKLRETRVETPERAEKLRRYRELKDQNGVLQTQLDEMKMFDPALMKEVRERVWREGVGCWLLVVGMGGVPSLHRRIVTAQPHAF